MEKTMTGEEKRLRLLVTYMQGILTQNKALMEGSDAFTIADIMSVSHELLDVIYNDLDMVTDFLVPQAAIVGVYSRFDKWNNALSWHDISLLTEAELLAILFAANEIIVELMPAITDVLKFFHASAFSKAYQDNKDYDGEIDLIEPILEKRAAGMETLLGYLLGFIQFQKKLQVYPLYFYLGMRELDLNIPNFIVGLQKQVKEIREAFHQYRE